jgi:hypothetical protein
LFRYKPRTILFAQINVPQINEEFSFCVYRHRMVLMQSPDDAIWWNYRLVYLWLMLAQAYVQIRGPGVI